MTIKKFVAGGVLALTLMMPVSASAAMTPQQEQLLQTLIQLVTQLQAQLAALIAAEGGTSGTGTDAPSASISASSLSQTAGSFRISGSASNTNNVTVFLEISGQNFTDYQTVNNQMGKDGFYKATSNVSRGKWSASFSYSSAASFTVLVFDSSTHVLLTTGRLTVSGSAQTGAVSCAYISNSDGTTRGINISSSASASTCKSLCVMDRNAVYGESDAGACVYTSTSGFQTVMSIPSATTSTHTPTAGERGAAVIGVYEGSHPGQIGSYGVHPEGTVNLSLFGETGQQRDLVLTSYEPINWVLSVPSSMTISKIIVAGYYKSRVTNVPPGTQVEYHSYDTDGTYYYSYESSGSSYTKLNNWVAGMYTNSQGNPNVNYTFPGYSASSLSVYMGYKG